MTYRNSSTADAPKRIVMNLIDAEEITKPGDVLLSEGHFYPIGCTGVPASEYDLAAYRPSIAEDAEAAA